MENPVKSIWHQLLLILVGALATGCVGTGLTYYVSELQRAEQMRAEQASQRSKSGVELEQRLLRQTGSLLASLAKMKNLTYAKEFDATAREAANAELVAAYGQWRANVFALRNEIGRIFGRQTADIVFSPASKNYMFDNCLVLITRDDKARNTNCNARLGTEKTGLDRIIAAANAGRAFREQTAVIVPVDFHANLFNALALLDKTNRCQKDIAEGNEDKDFAANCAAIRSVTAMRVNLVGLSQEELSNRFFAIWTEEE